MTELSPETRALLATAECPPLSAERRAQLKRDVVVRIAAGATLATTSAALTKSGGGIALTTKLVIFAATVGLAVGGVVALNRAHQTPVHVGTTPSGIAPAPEPEIPAKSAPSDLAPDLATVSVESLPSAPSPIRSTRSVATRPAATAESARSSPTPTEGSEFQTPTKSALTIEEEARLLRTAHQTMEAGDPVTALSLLDAHAAKFPRSVLEPERSAERVLALCRAGRTADARAATPRFFEVDRPPPLASKVRAACGGSEK